MNTAWRNCFLFCAGVLILWGCAQTVPISGGPKDETPPDIVDSKPENYSTHFSGRKIVLEFDEYIEVNGLDQNTLVSPPLEYPLEYKIRGKQLTVNIQDTLNENTTYIFNFGEAVVDYNEGNPLDSNLFVFSTGDELDSLELSGKLIDADDLKPVEGALAMLYKTNEDSLPYKEKPYFVARSDENGQFTLKYLPQGHFKLFALEDGNRSFTYNEFQEKIGFSDSLVQSGADSAVEVRMFKEKDRRLRVKDFEEVHYGHAFISFSVPVDSFNLKPINKTKETPFLFEWNKERDSVNLWLKDDEQYDTLEYALFADTITDTLRFQFKPREKFLDKKKEQSTVEFNLKPEITGKLDYFDSLHFSVNHPVSVFKPEGWLFIEKQDTLLLDSLINAGVAHFEKDTAPVFKRFSLVYDWQQNTSYSIVIPDSQIYDLFGLTHDTVNVNFSVTEEADYGELKVNFDFPEPEGQYIFYVSDKGGQLLQKRTVNHDEVLVFPRIKPGTFTFKIIDDRNGNGKWDPGKYLEKRQAEPVLFHPDAHEMRPNWDLEIDWLLENHSLISN